MTNKNIVVELLDLLKKIYPKKMLVSLFIDNGFLIEDLYKIGFNDVDIAEGVEYNFKGE